MDPLGLDDRIHARVRLAIMALLAGVDTAECTPVTRYALTDG